MIKLDQYTVFREVARRQSFSAAANSLYMTQSAISQQIKTLEDSLGVTLFIRSRSGAKLTPQGEILLEHVEKALDIFTEGENKISKFTVPTTGELRIAAGDTISKHYLLPVLEKFNGEYPKIKLNIVNRVTTEAITLVREGKADFAVVNLPLPSNEPKIAVKKVKEIHDIFVGGEKFSQLKDKPLPLEEIKNLPLIMLEEKSNSRIYTDRFFKENGICLNPEIELGSHDLLLEFAVASLGVSCVIKEFAEEYLSSDKLFEIKIQSEIPPRSIGICYLKDVVTTVATDKFFEMLSISQS